MTFKKAKTSAKVELAKSIVNRPFSVWPEIINGSDNLVPITGALSESANPQNMVEACEIISQKFSVLSNSKFSPIKILCQHGVVGKVPTTIAKRIMRELDLNYL